MDGRLLLTVNSKKHFVFQRYNNSLRHHAPAERANRVLPVSPRFFPYAAAPIYPFSSHMSKSTRMDRSPYYHVFCDNNDARAARKCVPIPDKIKHDESSEQINYKSETAPGEAPQLNREQSKVLQLVMAGASVFIGGNAGTGKSFLMREISRALLKENLKVVTTASTGVAAVNIGGNTFHSALGVPVNSEENEGFYGRQDKKKINFNLEVLATNIDVLLIDEVSMLHAGYLEYLDRCARAARESTKPFGGLQVILSGDFMQLTPFSQKGTSAQRHSFTYSNERFICRGVLPLSTSFAKGDARTLNGKESRAQQSPPPVVVKRRYAASQYINLAMYDSYAFRRYLLHIQLTQPTRQSADPEFVSHLNQLRRGVLPYQLSRCAFINPPQADAIRLYATKKSVRTFNALQMLSLPGEEHVFRSKISLSCREKMGEGDARYLSEVVLLHLSFKWRRMAQSKVGAGARALVEEVCTKAGLNVTDCCTLADIPFNHHQYAKRIFSVGIRFRGETRKDAASRIERFYANLSHMSPMAASGLVLLRSEQYSSSKLSQLVKPSLNQQFEKLAKNDFVLQNKVLKVGCRVMLVRNLNRAYVNGSIGVIVDFLPLAKCGDYIPKDLKVVIPAQHLRMFVSKGAEDNAAADEAADQQEPGVVPLVRMEADQSLIAIPWITMPLPCALHDGSFFSGRVVCMPLTPAYAFTVHKIQGITIDHPVLFDACGMFPCDHMVYVAASRVKRFSHLRWVNVSPRMITVHKPSLAFTDSLCSVDDSVNRWNKWVLRTLNGRASHVGTFSGCSDQLFIPDWKHAVRMVV